MIYLTFYCSDIDVSKDFYVEKVGIFDVSVGSRLICNIHDGLILDLDDRRSGNFIQSFMLSSTSSPVRKIYERLSAKGVECNFRSVLPGNFLTIEDPDGNSITIYGNE